MAAQPSDARDGGKNRATPEQRFMSEK